MIRRVPRRLMWVYNVCSGQSVRIHTVNTVRLDILDNSTPSLSRVRQEQTCRQSDRQEIVALVRSSQIRVSKHCECAYVTLQMSYICVYVTVAYVYECHIMNLTRVQTIHLIKLQRKKIDTVGLCRPDVATDQDLHCLPLILSHITPNKRVYMGPKWAYSGYLARSGPTWAPYRRFYLYKTHMRPILIKFDNYKNKCI